VIRLEIKTARQGLDLLNVVFLSDTGKATRCMFPEQSICDKRKLSP